MEFTKQIVSFTYLFHKDISLNILFTLYNKNISQTEGIKDHSGRDHTLKVWNHSIERFHKNVNTTDFKIIKNNFHNNKRKRKIAEALLIKDPRPTLNMQEKSFQLKLFN